MFLLEKKTRVSQDWGEVNVGGGLFYCNKELSGFLRDSGFFHTYILKYKRRIILLF